MPWYIWVVIIYLVIDRLGTTAMCGRGKVIPITSAFAVVSWITGGLMVWAIVAGVTG